MPALLTQMQHLVNPKAPVATHHHHRDSLVLNQPVQIRTRDVEDLSGLLRCEQSVMGEHCDCLTSLEVVEKTPHQHVERRRH